MADWTERIVGARMAVDQEFTGRVAESRFSSQQWGLIMTAVEFEIEHPENPDRARIVADTSKLPHVLPELDDIGKMGPMGGPGAVDDAGRSGDSGGGLLDGVKRALGLGGGASVDDQRREAAEALAQEYAEALQDHLEAQNQWDEVRSVAAREE